MRRHRKRRMWLCVVQIAMVLMAIECVSGATKILKVGGVFETDDYMQELAFQKAIEIINADMSLLTDRKLLARIHTVSPQDSFRALKKGCELASEGILALVGPRSPANAGVLGASCNALGIPLLQTHWHPRSRPWSHALSLFPDSGVLASAVAYFIEAHHWKTFTLIFEDNDALIRLQEILHFPTRGKDPQVKVILRHAKPDQNFKKFMKDLHKIQESNFVVDLPLPRVIELFKSANEVEMMTEYQNYFLTSLDVHTIEWSPDVIGRSNISAFRLIDPENFKFKRFLDTWIISEQAQGFNIPSKQPITTEAALVYDAMLMLVEKYQYLNRTHHVKPVSLSCRSAVSDWEPVYWEQGSLLADLFKFHVHGEFEGTSGTIRLNANGLRTEFFLDLLKFKKGQNNESTKIIKIGTWDTENKFQYLNQEVDRSNEVLDMLKNATLRVTVIASDPYLMVKEEEGLEGNDRFEGYSKDLLGKLSAHFGFKYKIELVKDKNYGARSAEGIWNGMVGELLRKEADIAIADLSITSERESAVDFTMPFMNLGISILFKKPEKQTPPMSSFLNPLSLEVWFYMGTAYLGVSLFLFILARLSPYEWLNPHPCEADNKVVENHFSLINSFWFTMGSIMCQGSNILPRAISTRIVASSWWFFTLIMIKSYTANLAAFLTAQRMTSPIESAMDLAKQTTIQYGCVKSGSTKKFFENSNYPVYKAMWSFMESQRPSVFTDDNHEGIERVRMGNYAFLMESASIEYVTERNCDLTRIGGELDQKGYGIATPPGSPYRSVLSEYILALQENQELQQLKDLWWKPADRCPDDSGSASAEMGVRNVGGVFLVLALGPFLGVLFVVVEFVWKSSKRLERGSIMSMLWHEIRSTLGCRGSTRPSS